MIIMYSQDETTEKTHKTMPFLLPLLYNMRSTLKRKVERQKEKKRERTYKKQQHDPDFHRNTASSLKKRKEYCQEVFVKEGFKQEKHLNLDLDLEGIQNIKRKKECIPGRKGGMDKRKEGKDGGATWQRLGRPQRCEH